MIKRLSAIELLTPHISTLARKRLQTVYRDDYGNEILDKWHQEVDYFIDKVLSKDNLISDFLNQSKILAASASGVHLIHFSELGSLANKLGGA